MKEMDTEKIWDEKGTIKTPKMTKPKRMVCLWSSFRLATGIQTVFYMSCGHYSWLWFSWEHAQQIKKVECTVRRIYKNKYIGVLFYDTGSEMWKWADLWIQVQQLYFVCPHGKCALHVQSDGCGIGANDLYCVLIVIQSLLTFDHLTSSFPKIFKSHLNTIFINMFLIFKIWFSDS